MPRAFLIKKRERPAQGETEGGEGGTGACDSREGTVEEGVEGGEECGSAGEQCPGREASEADACEVLSSPACSPPTCPSPQDSEDEIDVESPGLTEEDHLPRAAEILEKQKAEDPAPMEKPPQESQRSGPPTPVEEHPTPLRGHSTPSEGTTSPPRSVSRRSPTPPRGHSTPPTKYGLSPTRKGSGASDLARDEIFRAAMAQGRGFLSPPPGLHPWGQRPSPIPPLVSSHSLAFPPSQLLLAGHRAGQCEKFEGGSSRRGGELFPRSQQQRQQSPPKLPSSRSAGLVVPASSPTPAPAPTSHPTTTSCAARSPMCVTPISVYRSSPYHEKLASCGSSPPAVVSHIHSAYPRLHLAQERAASRTPPPAFLPHGRPAPHSGEVGQKGRGHLQLTPPPSPTIPAHRRRENGIKEERGKLSPSNDDESRPFSPVSRLFHRKFGQVPPSSKASALEAPEKKHHQAQPDRGFQLFQNGSTRPGLGSHSSIERFLPERGSRGMAAFGPKDLSCRPRSPSAVYHRSRSPLVRASPERSADSASRRSDSNPSAARRMSPPRPTPHRPAPHVPRSPSRPTAPLSRSRSPGPPMGVPGSSPSRRGGLGHPPASLPQSLFHPVTVRPTPLIPTSLHLSPRGGLPPSPPLVLKERRDSVGVPSPTGSDLSGRHHGNGGGSSSGRNSTSSSQSPLGSPSGSPPEPPRIPDGLAVSWPQQGSSAFMGSFPHHSPFLPFNLRLLQGLPAPPPPGSRSFSEASPLPFRPFPELTSSAFKGAAPFLPPSPYFPGFRYPMNFSPTGTGDAGKAMMEERRAESLDLSRLGKAPFESMLKYPPHLDALHPGGKAHPFLPTPAELEAGLLEKKKSKENEPTRFHCDSCKKSYSTFSGLSKHKQYHCASQVKKEFNCKYCDRTYISLGALKMHIRTHTLPCKCKLCGKAFSRPWLLQGHIRTHTGEKPFACPHCARAFADRSNLRAHLQTHSDVKKYSCRGCSKTFSRMSLLVKHEDGCCSPNSIH